MNLKKYAFKAGLLNFLIFSFACTKNEKFDTLTDQVSSPTDVAVSKNGQYFYALNSDFDRTYNQGSILVINEQGEKVSYIYAPRLGRSLTRAGDLLIATFSGNTQDDQQGSVKVYSLTDPAHPKELYSFTVDCSPLNAALEENYPYFAVSCIGGAVFLGYLDTNSPQNNYLIKIRQYVTSHRAIYIDTKRHLLFAFVTDLRNIGNDFRDSLLEDKLSYSEETSTDASTSKPNEIPDVFESSYDQRIRKDRRQRYQVAVINIAREVSPDPMASLPVNTLPTNKVLPTYRIDKDPIFQRELRWLYFSVVNLDGTIDSDDESVFKPNLKYYRTNFWSARKNPFDVDSFYLSHRGPAIGAARSANQILKVRITDDIAQADYVYSTDTIFAPPPKTTASVLKFERVFGFKDQLSPKAYTNDFSILKLDSRPIIIVNSFRDVVNFEQKSLHYSIAAQTLDLQNQEDFWFANLSKDNNALDSYYQFAVNPNGKILSSVFYCNCLSLMDLKVGLSLSEVKRIY